MVEVVQGQSRKIDSKPVLLCVCITKLITVKVIKKNRSALGHMFATVMTRCTSPIAVFTE